MRLSARNVLKGRIVEVKKGATTAHVRIELPGGEAVADILAALGPLPFGGAVEQTRRRRAEPALLVNDTVERSSLTVGE